MGLFFTHDIQKRILNEIEVKDADGNTVSKSDDEPLADDANKDTNDGFGTDPDGGYANRGGDSGGGGAPADDAGGGEEPVPQDDGGGEDYTLPDDGGEEPTDPDAEGGEEPMPDDSEEPLPDDGGEGGEEPMPDDGGDIGGDGGEAPLPDGGDSGGGEEPTDPDAEGGEEPLDGEDGDGEDAGDGEDGGADTDKSIDDQIKEVEKELFANISPEQMKEKTYKLKKDYIDLYETIVKLGEDLIRIPRNSNTQVVLDFLNKKTEELKELVSYNMLHNFDNKTYIENTITYQECLAALNSISNILADLEETYNVEDEEEDDNEDKPVDPEE